VKDILNTGPDRAEVLKVINRITSAIGKSDPATVFVACAYIMQAQADILGIGEEMES
jgi:hypothetical protein